MIVGMRVSAILMGMVISTDVVMVTGINLMRLGKGLGTAEVGMDMVADAEVGIAMVPDMVPDTEMGMETG
jgi:hypothetical protein